MCNQPSTPFGGILVRDKEFALPFKQVEGQASRGNREKGGHCEIDEQTGKEKCGLTGSAMVSEAFFPFQDGVDEGI